MQFLLPILVYRIIGNEFTSTWNLDPPKLIPTNIITAVYLHDDIYIYADIIRWNELECNWVKKPYSYLHLDRIDSLLLHHDFILFNPYVFVFFRLA